MVRATGPFFSLDARGTLGDILTGSFWKGVNYIRTRVIPHNPRSSEQTAVRSVLTDGVSKWRFGAISQLHKNYWNTYAKGLSESGFNRFLRAYIEANFNGTTKVSPQVIPNPS